MWRLVTAGDSDGDPYLTSLNDNVGRQYWVFEENTAGIFDPEDLQRVEQARDKFVKEKKEKGQNHSGDELLRLQAWDKVVGANIVVPEEELPGTGPVSLDRVTENIRAGIRFAEAIQRDDGHWAGDYGGPMFLLPGLVVTAYVIGKIDAFFPGPAITELIRYQRNHQNDDGGYGLHIEGNSTMFGTCLNYIQMRILGVAADDEMAKKARDWIHARGGATYCTSWGKFFMSVLGVYAWEGLNPLPPEMWLLPHSMFSGIGVLHPGRMWCHCRMVYLPMCYVYGSRDKLTSIKPTKLVEDLRAELYVDAYDSIDWNGCRNLCAKEDLYYPHPWIQDAVWLALHKAERFLQGSWLRKKAMAEVIDHIHYEDENTRYVCIGPVNKVINMLATWLEDPDSEAFKKHLSRVRDFLWVAEDGMKMQGYNGSQLWDTSFMVQSIFSTGMDKEFVRCLRKAHSYLEKTQVINEVQQPLEKYYRHISKGAWPFSTRDHGWPISDCSSEGLKAALLLAGSDERAVGKSIPEERLFDCVNVILSYQNDNGGMATYELTRSYPWIEVMNPAETFGDIIIDYSYVECTSASLQALTAFSKRFPDHRAAEIAEARRKGRDFILSIQQKDGSWYGSWAVCFTYGTWFGVLALSCFGETYKSSEAVRLACAFLLDVQKKDGGWGESYLSCQDKVYSQLDESHVVNTSWAILTLIAAKYHEVNPEPLHRAVKYLISVQSEHGDWPQQHISGVFNRNCMISYTNYRYIFPVWALGRYRSEVLQGEEPGTTAG
ncbi:hypothetical protein BSKO_10664 [Bryopsis sp. KO-2023]|nr:hypothetical protein BSKO_10664 [Bryopsis sp. KO-2023]